MSPGQSVPPVSQDERTTERRLVPASSGVGGGSGVESSRESNQEDFLFHLFRGSELLQENRVLEAKEQLEFALTMQPSDPKGQDLLAAVYFRLGLYPHAIQIYEGLEAAFPSDTSIKSNLALGYLKTGQPDRAKRVLQESVRLNPEHKKTWGYLGLALQKLGELEQAQIAFERGGHALMARRMTERRQRGSIGPSDPPPAFDGVQSAAHAAFSELDAGELRFSLAAPASPRPSDGVWHTVEPGDAGRGSLVRSAPPSALAQSGELLPSIPPQSASTRLVPPAMSASAPTHPGEIPALLPDVEGPPGLTLLVPGIAVASVPEDAPLALRLEALRVVSGAVTTRVLHRRVRETETSEVMGGMGSPLVRVTGGARLLIGARAGQTLSLVTLSGEIAFVREDALLAFDLRLTYENGKVSLDPPGENRAAETVAIAQLRGAGALLLETPRELSRLPCAPGRPLLVRREWVVGWLGRLVPRALSPSDSPGGQRGLIAFSGEGALIVSAQ